MKLSRQARLLNSRIKRVPKPMETIPEVPKVRQEITVIRVDPYTQGIARKTISMSTEQADGASAVARECRTNMVGHHPLDLSFEVLGFEQNGTSVFVTLNLMAAGGLDVDRGSKGWMLDHQSEDTGGIGLIFALREGGGMVSLPAQVTVAWVRDHIVWTEGKPDDEAAAEA